MVAKPEGSILLKAGTGHDPEPNNSSGSNAFVSFVTQNILLWKLVGGGGEVVIISLCPIYS